MPTGNILKTVKKIGICIDHASAHIIEVRADGMEATNIL